MFAKLSGIVGTRQLNVAPPPCFFDILLPELQPRKCLCRCESLRSWRRPHWISIPIMKLHFSALMWRYVLYEICAPLRRWIVDCIATGSRTGSPPGASPRMQHGSARHGTPLCLHAGSNRWSYFRRRQLVPLLNQTVWPYGAGHKCAKVALRLQFYRTIQSQGRGTAEVKL